jgi:hypothetical protein
VLYTSDLQGCFRSWDINQQRERWSFSILDWAVDNAVFDE